MDIDTAEAGGVSVRARLIRAADAEIAARGSDVAFSMEVIAKRAGVSRATAFRQLGSTSEVMVQVALLRAQRHLAAVSRVMEIKAGAFAKIEAALIYTARELPTDASIATLIDNGSASVHEPRVHQAALDIMGPVLREGQRTGEIREDVVTDDLVDFLVEQTYLAAREIDRSEAAVRRRFRLFIAPALESRGNVDGALLSYAREAQHAVSVAAEALANVSHHVR